jgi:hypothetical protein
MRENKIEGHLVERVGEKRIRKVAWIGRAKAPDRLVLLNPAFFAEIKRDDLPGKFPRDAHERAQWREHERMRAAGLIVHVLESIEDVDDVLEGYVL